MLDEFLGIAVWGQVAIVYGKATERGAGGCCFTIQQPGKKPKLGNDSSAPDG